MNDYSVVGLLYGDECKGATVDAIGKTLVDDGYDVVGVKHGGAQAAHRVVYEGTSFVYSQLSAASHRGAKTVLAPDFVVDLPALVNEIEGFEDAFGFAPDVWVSSACPTVTPDTIQMSHEREVKNQHGSTGRGVGWARVKNYSVRQFMKELYQNPNADQWTTDSWHALARVKVFPGTPAGIRGIIKDRDVLVHEASQGVCLDQEHGFFPHCVRTDTTFGPANRFREMLGRGRAEHVGCLRTYTTRHGNGPLMAEFDADHPLCEDAENKTGKWQGRFRAGPIDRPLIDYALHCVGGVDWLSVSCWDREVPEEYIVNYTIPQQAAAGSFKARESATGWMRQQTAQFETLTGHEDWLDGLPRVKLRGFGPSADEREWA